MATDILAARAMILRGIREFFWSRGFLEVETPVLLAHPSQEPYLEPLHTMLHDERGRAFDGFLRMSPEFSLKKLVAALFAPTPSRSPSRGEGEKKKSFPTSLWEGGRGGVGDGSDGQHQMAGVFELGPVFRDGEPWGGNHNPEFTMLEWYEVGVDYRKLMTMCEELILFLVKHQAPSTKLQKNSKFQIPKRRACSEHSDLGFRYCLGFGACDLEVSYRGQRVVLDRPWERLTMRAAWKRYARLDLDALLTRSAMARACRAKGYTVHRDDTFDDLFFKIHLTEVEPKLGREQPTFLTDWPVQMAALARTKPRDPRYAERVELYIGGLELANGFSELTNADEQLRRFRSEQRLRKRLGRPVYPIDDDFIAALRNMPRTAGIALGVDRLVMLLTDAKSIQSVRWLGSGQLFKK